MSARLAGPYSCSIRSRLAPSEYRLLVERAERAGATTPSDYIRHVAVAGPETQLPSHETLCDLRNAVIKAELAKDHPALISALDRISRL
jgi:Mobilization protein NikA